MDPFHSLLWETFMPRIRSAVVTWNSRHPDSLIQVNEFLKPCLWELYKGVVKTWFCIANLWIRIRHPDSLIQVNESDEPLSVLFGAFSGLFYPFEDLKVNFSTNFELLAIKIF